MLNVGHLHELMHMSEAAHDDEKTAINVLIRMITIRMFHIPGRDPEPEPEPLDAELRRIFANEGKIPAIKHYRTETGCGLKTAKDYVEEVCSDLASGAILQQYDISRDRPGQMDSRGWYIYHRGIGGYVCSDFRIYDNVGGYHGEIPESEFFWQYEEDAKNWLVEYHAHLTRA